MAIFDSADKELLTAAYVAGPNKVGRGPRVHTEMANEVLRYVGNSAGMRRGEEQLWVEFPQVYRAEAQKGDPNDLLDVAGVASACSAVMAKYCGINHVIPRMWKGTIKKDVMLERIRQTLSPDELVRIQDAGALTHNAVDAAGIGLFALGRLSRRVYAP